MNSNAFKSTYTLSCIVLLSLTCSESLPRHSIEPLSINLPSTHGLIVQGARPLAFAFPSPPKHRNSLHPNGVSLLYTPLRHIRSRNGLTLKLTDYEFGGISGCLRLEDAERRHGEVDVGIVVAYGVPARDDDTIH